MKKIICIILLIISASAYSMDADEIVYKISSELIEPNKIKIWQDTRYYTCGVQWTTVNYVMPNRSSSYSMYLEDGIPYVFYTLSDGPAVQGCVSLDNGSWKRCSKISNKIIFKFDIKKSGMYHYTVYSRSENTGIQTSYLSYLWKDDSKIMMRQEEYNEDGTDNGFWTNRGVKRYHPRDYQNKF
jgi:hypothetical protein